MLSRAYTTGGCILGRSSTVPLKALESVLIGSYRCSLAGAIFGTGTNGAYLEDVHKIRKLANSPSIQGIEKMVVNTEWGGFNNSVRTVPTRCRTRTADPCDS